MRARTGTATTVPRVPAWRLPRAPGQAGESAKTGSGGGDRAGDLDLLDDDQFTDAGADLLTPPVALVDGAVEAHPVLFVLETPEPDIAVGVLLVDERGDHGHPLRYLERDDDL